MESRACSFSDNSVVSFDVTMGAEGEETENSSRVKYLQTSTPFVHSKPPVSTKLRHTSLDTCEELDEQSCCAPQDMSLEASAINASSVTPTSSGLLSKSDESDSLVNENLASVTNSATSASEMNIAFWGNSLKDSSSKLSESSTSTASRVSSEYRIVEEDVAVDLTVQGMLNKSFTETEPSNGVCEIQGHSDEIALDRSEIENSGVSMLTVETAAAGDLSERCTATATEAAQVQVNGSVGLIAKTSSSASIYLDDGTAENSKPSTTANHSKRLTMAQRATMEAMAAFGGSDFGSVQVRRVDLHAQLKGEAEARKRKQEREEGQPLAKRTRPVECLDGPVDDFKAPPRRLTRVEQARLEALKSFDGSSLTDTLGASKRRVARTLEAREKKGEDGGGSSGEKAGSEDKENCVHVVQA